MGTLATTIPIITAIIAAIWGIYVFNKQQKFTRLQNLGQILQRFADRKEFIDLFSLFDQSLNIDRITKEITYNEVHLLLMEKEKPENKLQFLVLLEEVALYANAFQVDRDYAVHLFQWHFYYVYNNPKTSVAFWKSFGGISEIEQHYWKYQRDFSKYCNPVKSYR